MKSLVEWIILTSESEIVISMSYSSNVDRNNINQR